MGGSRWTGPLSSKSWKMLLFHPKAKSRLGTWRVLCREAGSNGIIKRSSFEESGKPPAYPLKRRKLSFSGSMGSISGPTYPRPPVPILMRSSLSKWLTVCRPHVAPTPADATASKIAETSRLSAVNRQFRVSRLGIMNPVKLKFGEFHQHNFGGGSDNTAVHKVSALHQPGLVGHG